ncbi:hypothetical protein ABZ354_26385 [Streptomyces sp. NPDC005925]|uniref:hypothetical protein n=1 Tax=Streptomyces sp. NPDC005925 TaxID=3157172 RepID=UPI0033FE1E7A
MNGDFRYVGPDDCGKSVYVSTAPGGMLEAVADKSDVLSAHALSAVVRAVLDSEEPATDEELAAFVPQLADALEAVVDVAGRLL